jgi:outer membrane protein OmpA-like peptidoglycan-associated protein
MAAGEQPVFRASVTARTAKAVNYQHRSGATKIDFRGTSLLPASHGEAKVEGKQGYIEIEVEFRELKPANLFGAEYLTYVLWAITPEGRTSNLGEILLNGTSSKLNVSTELQVFGLVVTAEPYYAVTRPSDLIVMENVIRAETLGKVEEIDAKYELLQRGQYMKLSNPLALKLDKNVPLELYEARNAVQIARSIGADRFASDSFVKAEKSLAQAEAYQARKAGKKPVTMMAREAVQTAEDARMIAVKRQEEEALIAERQRSADRENRAESARAAAENETNRVNRESEAARIAAKAETDRLMREKEAQSLAATEAAERVRLENSRKTEAATAEADRLRLENEARLLAANNEAARVKLENEARLGAAAAEADRLKRENEEQVQKAIQLRDKAEREKAELRILLLKQFNTILQTRDTARGLIVNMPDVLFDTGKFTLRPAAREKLARVAGIVSAHAGLKLEIEGHTDSVGSEASNQKLSENRGNAVLEYLTQQGMASSSLTSKGFGEGQPAASNDNAAGRQQNRRVEIVVSGELIGTEIGKIGGAQ